VQVGVLQIPYGTVVRKGRLQPGRMLLVDTKEHTIVDDSEFKAKVTGSQPFRQWIDEEAVRLTHLTERLHTTHVKSDMASTSVMFDRYAACMGPA
jgi:glutamate synthase (NADPH/NADH) large chain